MLLLVHPTRTTSTFNTTHHYHPHPPSFARTQCGSCQVVLHPPSTPLEYQRAIVPLENDSLTTKLSAVNRIFNQRSTDLCCSVALLCTKHHHPAGHSGLPTVSVFPRWHMPADGLSLPPPGRHKWLAAPLGPLAPMVGSRMCFLDAIIIQLGRGGTFICVVSPFLLVVVSLCTFETKVCSNASFLHTRLLISKT